MYQECADGGRFSEVLAKYTYESRKLTGTLPFKIIAQSRLAPISLFTNPSGK